MNYEFNYNENMAGALQVFYEKRVWEEKQEVGTSDQNQVYDQEKEKRDMNKSIKILDM